MSHVSQPGTAPRPDVVRSEKKKDPSTNPGSVGFEHAPCPCNCCHVGTLLGGLGRCHAARRKSPAPSTKHNPLKVGTEE